MAKQVLSDCGIYLGGFELSGFSNQVALEIQKDLIESTTFGSGNFKTRLGGLPDARFSAGGCWSSVEVGAVLDSKLGSFDEIVSLAGSNAAGGVVYFMRGVEGEYSINAVVNDIAKWNMSGTASTAPVARGKILARSTGITATGSSTPIQMTGVTALQSIYAAAHVFSVAGTTPSITFKVQSDNAVGFPSSADRLTFTAMTAVGAQWKESLLPGVNVDDFWRVNYTISGTSPIFGFVVAFAIL